MGGIPPACRNHLEPTACDTPVPTAASSLDAPRAIASQNRTRSSRRAVDGLPGDHICPRIARIACWRFPAPIPQHLQIEVLRRPVESAEYTARSFQAACGRLGVTPAIGPPGSALANAVIETCPSTPEWAH